MLRSRCLSFVWLALVALLGALPAGGEEMTFELRSSAFEAHGEIPIR
jgi:hypothetical protein